MIAITGIGVVSPLGIGRKTVQQAVAAKVCGIGELTLFEPAGACEHAGEVSGYNWKEFLLSKQTYADRLTQLAVGAAYLALQDAAVETPLPEEADPVGLCFGTQWGCLEAMGKFYEPVASGKGKRASSLVFSHSYPNAPTSLIAIEFGLRGYGTTFTGDARAGLWAVRSAFDAIQDGTARCIVAGGADALSPELLKHLESAGALPDTRGQTPVFDTPETAAYWRRAPAEAAVFCVLEEHFAAEERGAQVLREFDEPPSETADSPDPRLGDSFAARPLMAWLFG